MKVALYGGSFDPFHRGHLEPAKKSAEWLGLDRVIYLPAKRPPHKPDRELTSPYHRFALVAASIIDEPWAEVSPWELDREGTTYCFEQLDAFRSARPGDEILLMIGADSLADFPSWKKSTEILRDTAVVVLPREPFDRERIGARVSESISERIRWFSGGEPCPEGPSAGAIWVLPVEPVTISSTDLRNRLAAGGEVRGEIPAAALELIGRHRLYRGQ